MRLVIAAAALSAASLQPAAAEQMWLTMDQVRPVKLEVPAHSVVVGNPAIADVSVQDNTNLLLFGKAPGLTNIYVFDAAGEAVKNLVIRVRTPSSDMLTVHRGAERTTYNCTVNCEATVTVGDSATSFGAVATQVNTKYTQATRLGNKADGGDDQN